MAAPGLLLSRGVWLSHPRHRTTCQTGSGETPKKSLHKMAQTFNQVDLKPLLNTACANIFNAYFCSVARRNYDDPILNEYCSDFDKVNLSNISQQAFNTT